MEAEEERRWEGKREREGKSEGKEKIDKISGKEGRR